MLKSADEHLAALRDGRKVFVGDELVSDVTSHPAFRNAARTLASLFDLKRGDVPLDVEKYEAGVTGYQPMRLWWFGQDGRSMRLCLPFVQPAPSAGSATACRL